MISKPAMTALSAIMVGLAGCSTSGPPTTGPTTGPTTEPSGTESITVTSPAFAADQPIPTKYSCDGAGISPPLSWRGVPAKTRELAVVIDDPDAPGGTYTHWVLVRIPVHIRSIAEGSTPPTSTEITNSSGRQAFAPLCPPSGKHHYRFTVYALSAATSPSDHSLKTGLADIADHTLSWGRFTATYQR